MDNVLRAVLGGVVMVCWMTFADVEYGSVAGWALEIALD